MSRESAGVEVEERIIPMEEAVGYAAVDPAHETPLDGVLVLKHARLYLVADGNGDIAPAGQGGLGLYHDDTRVLSHYELRFCGHPPVLLSSHAPKMYGAQIDRALSDRDFGGDPWDPKNSVHIRRELLLDDRLSERLTLTNFLTRDISFRLELRLGADFADIFEVRGWDRKERGSYLAPEYSPDAVSFSYRGRDGRLLRTMARFAEPPDEWGDRLAAWEVGLAPNETREIEWQIVPPEVEELETIETGLFDGRRKPLARIYRGWHQECAAWSSDVAEFDSALDQAVTDLRGLYVESEGEEIISAGIPWYSTAFGRDSLITSLQTLPLNPRIARDTLEYLAHHQGTRENEFTEEQPGKIMHELRRGELARAGEIPHIPYYGTIDATPLWLILLHETWRWTGARNLVERLLPNADRALEWIDRYGDLDGDGLVEYRRVSEKGLANQGWKDSHDGVSFPDGRPARAPIALVEVQGYVYDAKYRMASLFSQFGREERGRALLEEAREMGARIREQYWLPDLGTFALALDGEKQPVPTATSNAGHLLWSRVPTPEQARLMAAHLSDGDMFSGWGLRTLSARHPVYNPMSYHNGSIWPHDNAIVGLGLSISGHTDAALPIFSALYDAACGMRYHRLPELFCGMQRAHGMRPVLYPVSCSPQAWASGAFFMLLQGATGLLPDAPAGVLHVRSPTLPPFLNELTVRNLAVGESRVSLQFQRRGGRTLANLLGVEGDSIQVRIEI